jgi:hypothetical protein
MLSSPQSFALFSKTSFTVSAFKTSVTLNHFGSLIKLFLPSSNVPSIGLKNNSTLRSL